jgi:predicted Holliday junction resolvase-like endonuclease
MVILVIVLSIIVIFLFARFSAVIKEQDSRERGIRIQAQEQMQSELERHKSLVAGEYELKFDTWKSEHTEKERASAVKISRAVNHGLISEQFAPYLQGFAYNPKDCKFLGMPVDYVIFDGLDDGILKSVVLLDVKTGVAKLNSRQVQVKKAIEEGRVRFESFRPEMN